MIGRRDVLKGMGSSLMARLLPLGLLASPLAARVAHGPGQRGFEIAKKFGATGFTQPGLDYATRTGYIGYFTDKAGRAVGWLSNNGQIFRTIWGTKLIRDARGYELPATYVARIDFAGKI